jgi:hypothetical protein
MGEKIIMWVVYIEAYASKNCLISIFPGKSPLYEISLYFPFGLY